MADGDGRYLLSMIEEILLLPVEPILDTPSLVRVVQKRMPLYDKMGSNHYNLVSALHKSLQGSDADAALYWLARMLFGGDDLNYIMRGLVRFASEDIGMADPNALIQTITAWDAFERIGRQRVRLRLFKALFILLQRLNLIRCIVLKVLVFVLQRKLVHFRLQNIY